MSFSFGADVMYSQCTLSRSMREIENGADAEKNLEIDSVNRVLVMPMLFVAVCSESVVGARKKEAKS